MVKIFSERLKALRIEKGFTQPKLAERVGVSKGMISFWEQGIHEPTVSYIIKLSKVLDVSSDYLLGISDF